MGCHALLQGIFLTQELNQGLLHCRQIAYQLSYQGSPIQVHCFQLESRAYKSVHFLCCTFSGSDIDPYIFDTLIYPFYLFIYFLCV